MEKTESLDKESEIKVLQKKLIASGTKVQTSLGEYRKKLQASNKIKVDKNQSSVPSTSSDSLLSGNGKSEDNINKAEKNKLVSENKIPFKDKNVNLSKINSDGSLNLRKNLDTPTSEKKFSKKINADKNENFSKTSSEINNEENTKKIKEQITRIKNKISRFDRNNSDSQRYPPESHDNIGRHRSISERSSSTASANYINVFTNSNFRQRSTSGNYSTANSEISIPQSSNININANQNENKNDTDATETASKTGRKRSRGKRGGKLKTKETQANAEHIPYYARECDSLHINAETLLILDLLYLPVDQHTNYLLNLAKIRKILVPDNSASNGYSYNPQLTRLNSILQLGNQCRNLNDDDLKMLETLMSQNRDDVFTLAKQRKQQNQKARLESESKRNGERRPKYFEDYVNEIVGEYLPENMKEEFLFPKLSKAQKSKNYFNESKFEIELENYAQKLVNANLGVIVEGEIRINGKNNEQAFVKNVAGKSDAFINSLMGRKYALHTDVVRIFVRNDGGKQVPISNEFLKDTIQNIQNNFDDTKETFVANDPQPGCSKETNKNLFEEISNSDGSNEINKDLLKEISNSSVTSIAAESNEYANDLQPGCSKEANKDLLKEISNSSVTRISVEINENANDLQPGGTEEASQELLEEILNPCDTSIAAETNEEIDLNNTIESLLDQENEPLPEKSSKAFVIKIVKKVHNRRCVGNFLSYRKDCEYITLVPRDLKMPNIRVYKQDWPEPFKKGELQNINDVLYVAQITDWQNGTCIGKVLSPIGKCGELESENKAILLQNGLEMDPYEEKYNEMFYGPLTVTDEDVKSKEDLRSECIFTIDPLTARDLDDALSCKTLSNGNFEIGVHISDVTHFLEEKSELDEIVSLRSTSVYMVNEVFHMLPKPLCFKCSLLPGEDKFAFSCFWEVAPTGEILNTRISRTILNSCTQFAYEHAQKIIDNPNKEFVEDDFPQIHNGWSVQDIVDRVKNLQSIAELWREKRFEKGALRINKPKLYFNLDEKTGEPTEYFQAILQSANFLIEEFMLMANQTVANFIYKKFPKISFLRNHNPPLPNVIQKVQVKLSKLGIHIDSSSSKSIYDSLTKLFKDNNSQTFEVCITHLISKPMTRAKYFCSEKAETVDEFWHYALSIPIYTHFTSPIRRYPDILVHRVLGAALGYTKPPQRTPEELHVIAAICNEKKYTAKLAGDDSCNLYFMYAIKSQKCVLMKAAVLEFFFRGMEVILIESGHIIRVAYPTEKSSITINYNARSKTAFITKENEQPIELKPFSEIDVEVYVEKFKIKARLPGKTKKQSKNKIENENINKTAVVSNDSNQQNNSKDIDLESNNSSPGKENLSDSSVNKKDKEESNEKNLPEEQNVIEGNSESK